MGEQVLENNTPNNDKMSNTGSSSPHFILVHGVCHGGWCWYKVRALLETSGCSVTCIDLKASGIDSSDPDSVISFNDYNHPLLHLLASLPNHKKVILVGHSAGGISVTDAIHKFPEKIQAAVYIAATMLKLGFHSDQDLKDVEDVGECCELCDPAIVGDITPSDGIPKAVKSGSEQATLNEMCKILGDGMRGGNDSSSIRVRNQ